MAIRLYPNTADPAVLEKLAGVPAGTAAKLDALVRPFKAREAIRNAAWESADDLQRHRLWRESQDDADAKYELLNAHQHRAAGTYNSFLLFGWGRLIDPLGMCQGSSGYHTLPATIANVLRDQGVVLPAGVSVADTGGVHWG